MRFFFNPFDDRKKKKIREFVTKRGEITVDECAELLNISMEKADKLLRTFPEYEAHYKAYRGRKDFPLVFSLPWPKNPRERADGTYDMGYVKPEHAPLGAFEGVRAMGDD